MYSSTKLQVINYNTSLLPPPPPTTSGSNCNCICNCDVRWNKTFQTIHWAVLHVQCCVRQEDKEVFPHNCQYCVLTLQCWRSDFPSLTHLDLPDTSRLHSDDIIYIYNYPANHIFYITSLQYSIYSPFLVHHCGNNKNKHK